MEEQNTNAVETNKPGIKGLGILSIIGSSIYILIGLIGVFAMGYLMSMLGMGVSMASQVDASAYGVEGAEAAAAISSAASTAMTIYYIVFGVFILLAVIRLIGALRMMKWKKSGYTLYMIANVLFTLLFVYSLVQGFNIITLLITLAQIFFIVMFTNRKKHMA